MEHEPTTATNKTGEAESVGARRGGEQRGYTTEEMKQDEGWKTVRNSAKKAAGSVKKTPEEEKRSHASSEEKEKKLSPRSQKPIMQGAGAIKGAGTTKEGGASQGDGRLVFAQLRPYIANGAPPQYVSQTVVRLKELASERRFTVYKNKRLKEGQNEDEQTMRSMWVDKVTATQEEKYKGLVSYWDMQNKEHESRLLTLMKDWIMDAKLPQGEIETRLRFLHFKRAPSTAQMPTLSTTEPNSYLGAVTRGEGSQQREPLTNEQQRLRELCMEPATALTKLRKRTSDEDKALLMILNHEIEVPAPPHFLVQSMTARELACFTDIFLAIEYPLYAHLAPGQRFGANLSKQALLAQVYAGAEAAALQKQEIEEFKHSLSRISLDINARVLTVTFKGKQSAAKWVGWNIPMASKMLPLIDYEQQRVLAQVTNEVVRLDYYSFTVAVRRGEVSSQDMYWMLATKMGLDVQGMAHPGNDTSGLNDKQWTVRVKANACPASLRAIAIIRCEDTEIVVHHHEISELALPDVFCSRAPHAIL